jgi:hypothetical protein
MLSWSRMLALFVLAGIESAFLPRSVRAQDAIVGTSTAVQVISVFLDCDDCDTQFIRTEIGYVNWVRDRTVADVHVLVTSQDIPAGGDAFTLAFLGLRGFAGRGDTLAYSTNATTTDDEERRGLTQTLALGLVPFVARTPNAQSLRITMPRVAADAPGTQTMPARDPWRAWVFEIDLSGDLGGEQNYRNREFDLEFNANRTTEQWKTTLEISNSYSSERAIDVEFDSLGNVESEEVFRNIQRNWGVELVVVKSVNDHVSTGFRSFTGSNTFRNQRRRSELMPAVEYNVFPYSESTRRRLAFQFATGMDSYVYNDTTIFDKINETFPMYFASMNYATQQPWGESGIQLEHRGYLNDPSKRSTELNGSLSVRLFRGFNVRFGGGYSWIHNQVYLPKGERDQADVLLRRRALLTGYEYNAFFGVSYTFGSIFNNVVNPRFF